MEFRLLGQVEVMARDCPVDLGHRRQRLVLAVLALEANRLVPVERLIGLSWPTSPPRTATHAIQVSASHVRTALARASAGQHQVDLVGKGSGYMLRTDAMSIDAHRFRALVLEARDAASDEHKVIVLRQALRLWRGPVLTGIAPDETRDSLGRGLEEARLVALEDRIDAELRLARHRELLDELTGLVEVHPLRERLTGQLMLALHWSGQPGAALETFRRARQRLAEELGIDPGAELRRLEMALLRNDVTLAAPPKPGRPCGDGPGVVPGARPGDSCSYPVASLAAPPAQLPPAVADFTGRAAELRRLTDLIEEPAGPPGATTVTITGPAGVGKSALAVHWAQLTRHRFSDGQLFIDLRGFSLGPPLGTGAVLGRFLRALGVAAGDVPRDPDEAAALYRTMLADRRMLIILDNAATAQQVRPLLPAAPGCLVIITSRDRLAGLIARDGARHCSLDVLPPEEARTLLTKILGPYWIGTEPAAADRLVQVCGYLPLALRIAATNLASRPSVSISGCAAELSKDNMLSWMQVGDDEQSTLRSVLGHSYARLGQDARRLFRMAGVAPCQDLTARTATALAEITPLQARRLLDQLTSAHVLREHMAGRFAVTDMLRSYARELAEEEDSEHERASAALRLLEMYATTAAAAWRAVRSRSDRLTAVPAATALVRFSDTREAAAWLVAECVNISTARAYAADHGMRALARQLASAGRSLPAGAGELRLRPPA